MTLRWSSVSTVVPSDRAIVPTAGPSRATSGRAASRPEAGAFTTIRATPAISRVPALRRPLPLFGGVAAGFLTAGSLLPCGLEPTRVPDLRHVLESADRGELLGPALVHLVGLTRGQPDGLVQLDQLARREVTPGSGGNPGQRQRTDADAAELEDLDADLLHHDADDVVEAFVNHHLDNDALRALAQEAAFVRNDETPLDHDAIAQRLHLALVRLLAGDDVIFLRQPVSWVHDAVGDLADIGQQEDALRVAIEATDGIDPLVDFDKVHDGPALLLVGNGGDEAARLVQDDETGSLAANRLAVDADLVADGVDAGAQLGYDLAVDLDSSFGDQLFGRAPGGDASLGENALEAISTLAFVAFLVVVALPAHAATFP